VGSRARRGIPWNNQHRPRGLTQHTFADRTLSEPLPSSSTVGSKDDQVGFPRVGVQDDDASRIPVLFDDADWDAFPLGTFPQLGEQFETFIGLG
jgi:hypothetical protein